MAGFFSDEELARKPSTSLVPRCEACKLYRHCRSPRMPVSGEGRKQILILAEAPGKNEDREGIQLVGEAGQHLEDALHKVGIDMRKDCWLDNSLMCRPTTAGGRANRKPTPQEIAYCRPHVVKTILDLKPVVVLALGGVAISSLLADLYKDKPGYAISRWAGWRIPCQRYNTWICPTWHPSYLIRKNNEGDDDSDADPEAAGLKPMQLKRTQAVWEEHLRRAVRKAKARPWDVVPDFKQQVDVILDHKVAAERIMLMTEARDSDNPIAFDYEAEGLKPDGIPEIYCCSMSDGKRAIAYPWHGRAIRATRSFLKSDVPKIAANMKYEYRWTLRKLGIRPPNMVWDTMVAAHLLDCRHGITGLKFQAFVQFGQEKYSDHIEPYFDGGGANWPNRIRQAPLSDLLLYCGLDSLLEHKLAMRQMKQMGVGR